jgi:hypothetical protein
MLFRGITREKIAAKCPDAVVVLDHFRAVVPPFTEPGWTAFSDWLLACYAEMRKQPWPENVPSSTFDHMSDVIFSC